MEIIIWKFSTTQVILGDMITKPHSYPFNLWTANNGTDSLVIHLTTRKIEEFFWYCFKSYNLFTTLKDKNKPGASLMSQWLVGQLLGIKQKTRSFVVPSNNPTSDCETRLFLFLQSGQKHVCYTCLLQTKHQYLFQIYLQCRASSE